MNSICQPMPHTTRTPTQGSLPERLKAKAQGGVEAFVSNHIMKARLDDLAPQELTVQLFGAGQKKALALLKPRWTDDGRRQSAESNYAALTLARDIEGLPEAGPLFLAHAQTLRSLRAHFVPYAADLDQLRTDLAVRLRAGRDLHASLEASFDLRLRNQTYFVYCLCELLDKLDDCARKDVWGVSMLDPDESRTSIAARTAVACLVGASLYLFFSRT